VHDLRNPGPAPATSIHVYAPPLASMTYYGHDADGTLRPGRTERVRPGRPGALGLASGS
jgi:hypothetical protein